MRRSCVVDVFRIRRRFPPLWLQKGILSSRCLLILFIHTKHKTIRWCQGEFIDLEDKAKNVWLIVGQLPKEPGLWDASNMLRDFSRSSKHYGNAMSCLWPGGLRIKWCCGHKKGCYITTHQTENFSRTLAGPKQDSATRHHHPTTIKALHSRKIIKLGFLSLPYWFLTESSQYQSWKAKLFPALSGNNLGLLEFKIYVPPIMLLKHKNKGILKTLHT